MLEIKRIILHKLEVNEDEPTLSDTCLSVGTDGFKPFMDYFEKHLMTSREQSQTKRCQFKGVPDNLVYKNMLELFQSKEDNSFEIKFIDLSKRWTKRLHEIMQGTSSKSDGTLIVIHYVLDEQEHIGILKMDQTDGVQLMETEKGLSVMLQPDMLPTLRDKLHKSAMIILTDNYVENDLHLFVLDTQQGKESGAKFFRETFLNVRELATDKNMTRVLMKNIIEELNQLVQDSDTSGKIILNLKHMASSQDTFDVDRDILSLLRNYDVTEQEVENLATNVKKKTLKEFPDATFDVEIDQNSSALRTKFKDRNGYVELILAPNLKEGEDYEIRTGNNGRVTIEIKAELGQTFKMVV